MGTQKPVVFGFLSARGYEVQSLLLARSLRQFGGSMAGLPVWIFVPEGKSMSGPALDALHGLNVQIFPFAIDEAFRKFPFAAKTLASAVAEEQAEKEGALLAWHDRTGYVGHEPLAFHLPEGKTLGFRPTDIANIGAPYGQPLPPFWQTVLGHFHLDLAEWPPITTAIDQKELYLYINAGLLIVRPEAKVLRTWAANLEETYARPAFQAFYAESQAYVIFMHQAALTAAVLQRTTREERTILPDSYLFSVDNFFDYDESMRPARLDEITTGRFHDFFALPDWEAKIIASPELKDWFRTSLQYGLYWPEAA